MEAWIDPIVEEVRAAREAYARELQYDLASICDDLRLRQAEHANRIVDFEPKPLPETHKAA